MIEIDVLLHLIEVEHRRLHLDLGFPSMFQYCIESLEYPRATAARRLKVARCLRDFPGVASLLEAGEMSLGTVYLVARVLSSKNESTVLARVRGRSESEVESILVEFGGSLPKIKERLEKVRSRKVPEGGERGTVSIDSAPAQGCLDGNCEVNPPVRADRDSEISPAIRAGGNSDASPASRAGGNSDASPASRAGGNSDARPAAQPGAQQDTPVDARSNPGSQTGPETSPLDVKDASSESVDYRLTVVLGPNVMKKLQRALALRSRGAARKVSIAETLSAALDRYLFENCPKERDKRRRARETQQETKIDTPKTTASGPAATTVSPNTQEPSGDSSKRTSNPKRTPISQGIRDAVFTRDGGRCTFIGSNGRRCTATDRIEIDHRLPAALGGDSSMDNLRCLCRAHNQREADRLLGEEWMDYKRSRGRRKSGARLERRKRHERDERLENREAT